MLPRASCMVRMQDFVGRYVRETDPSTFHEMPAQRFQAVELTRGRCTEFEVSN